MSDRSDTYCDLCGECCTGRVHRFYGFGGGNYRDVCHACTIRPISELAAAFKSAANS